MLPERDGEQQHRSSADLGFSTRSKTGPISSAVSACAAPTHSHQDNRSQQMRHVRHANNAAAGPVPSCAHLLRDRRRRSLRRSQLRRSLEAMSAPASFGPPRRPRHRIRRSENHDHRNAERGGDVRRPAIVADEELRAGHQALDVAPAARSAHTRKPWNGSHRHPAPPRNTGSSRQAPRKCSARKSLRRPCFRRRRRERMHHGIPPPRRTRARASGEQSSPAESRLAARPARTSRRPDVPPCARAAPRPESPAPAESSRE